MDSWKLWELDPNQERRTGIKALAFEWLRQSVFENRLRRVSNRIVLHSLRWSRAFRTHIEEMHVRLKNGDVHVQVSNATSRALTGDTSLTVGDTLNLSFG